MLGLITAWIIPLTSSRLEQEARRLNILEESFYDADNISSLSLADVVEKLQTETARPEGFTVTKLDTELLIYWLQVSDSVPSIRACITVKESLSTTVNLDGKSVTASQFAIDLFTGPLRSMLI